MHTEAWKKVPETRVEHSSKKQPEDEGSEGDR